jgi:hypothetical protein
MHAILSRLFSSNDSENTPVVGGSNAALDAVMQRSGEEDRFIVYLGEPQLVDYSGEFSQDYKVRIPTFTETGDPNPSELVFDLPEGDIDESDSGLYALLEAYGIEVLSDLGDLEGKTVTGTLQNGSFDLHFDEVNE